MTGGPSYAEAPDEAFNDIDDEEEELSVAIGRLVRADQDELGETPLPPLVHSPLTPKYAPPDHIQPNPPDTSASLAQSSNSEPPEPHTPTPLQSHLAVGMAAHNFPNNSHSKASRARHETLNES